jgi:hypothetical protein
MVRASQDGEIGSPARPVPDKRKVPITLGFKGWNCLPSNQGYFCAVEVGERRISSQIERRNCIAKGSLFDLRAFQSRQVRAVWVLSQGEVEVGNRILP